jgi:hypothetical protein
MSELAVPATAVTAARRSRVISLSRVRRIGFVALGLQLIVFMTWSAILYNRYCLTYDFSLLHQAFYQIAHGNLDPYDSAQRISFWRNHFELIFWVLAPLYWVWPHGLMLPWLQDLAIVGAQAVAFTWICELAGRRREQKETIWLAVAGLVLLVANPWIWETVSWDYHTEPLTALFLVLLLRDLANGRRWAWAWALPMLLCGDVATTYLIGAGVGTALANRRSRARGLAVAGLGALAFVFIAVIHGNVGSGQGFKMYAYLTGGPVVSISLGTLLKGILTHPWVAVRTLAGKSADIWANLAPGGFLGVGFLTVLPVVIVVLLANDLWPSLLFAAPGFQNIPLYLLLPVGTVGVLGWLNGRNRVVARLLACLVVAQALAWTAVWGPRVPGQWLRVPADTAATLAAAQALIPADAEVVVSQGVVGRFSFRADTQPLMSTGLVPVHGGEMWFVLVPMEGIETESTASAMAFIGELAGPLGATLVMHANGVWVFRWHPPAGTTTVMVPGDSSPIDAWVSPGAAGRAVLSGPVSGWHAASTGAMGYVADEMAWQQPTGRYLADITLSTTGPVNVEVWDDTGNVLLARRTVMASGVPEQVTLPVAALTAYSVGNPWGWGLFHADFLPPPPGQRLEVRVWSPGGTFVNVYSAELNAAPAGATRRTASRSRPQAAFHHELFPEP